MRVPFFPGTTFLNINAAKGIKARVQANKRLIIIIIIIIIITIIIMIIICELIVRSLT